MRLMAIRHVEMEHGGEGEPWRRRIVTPVEGPDRGASVAWVSEGFNLLAGGVPVIPKPAAATLVTLSGWLPPDAGMDASGSPEASFETWTKAGWDRLFEVLQGLIPMAERAGARIAIMPHARTVVSDPQACLTLLRNIESETVGLAIDPCAMLTPDMLSETEDHLARAYEALAELDRTWLWVLTNVSRVENSGGLRRVPLHLGELDADMLIETALRQLRRSMPSALLEEALPKQLATIRASELRVGRA